MVVALSSCLRQLDNWCNVDTLDVKKQKTLDYQYRRCYLYVTVQSAW